jgi:hypothetical protein
MRFPLNLNAGRFDDSDYFLSDFGTNAVACNLCDRMHYWIVTKWRLSTEVQRL